MFISQIALTKVLLGGEFSADVIEHEQMKKNNKKLGVWEISG
jgi:hypothetical protein